jgi:hypothetical protein
MTTKQNPAAGDGRAPNSFCLAVEGQEGSRTALHVQENVIGIDSDIRGELALVSRDGDVIDVADMPTLHDGSGSRAAVNAPLLAELLARWHAQAVFCEFVSGRPGEGPTGAFSFGRSRGVIEAVCAVLGLPIRFLTLRQWERLAGVAGASGRRIRRDRMPFADGPRRPRCSPASAMMDAPRPPLIGLAGLIRERT